MKKLMLFLLVLSASVCVSAQTTIQGVVSSGSDGLTMPGVSVIVKGTKVGTATDVDGKFSLSIPSDRAALVFTYIGYKTKEVAVSGNSRNVQVVLDEDTQLLEELVVVGYGTMKRSDLTGAVSSIGAEDIRRSMSTSLAQAMQGRVAGVQVMQNSGAPGGGISVSIRGINSLLGNEPLYVVDGVSIESRDVSSINPADIVTIDVLKGASATAIYGSRAANGVIMITTKQGETGKPKLSYDGYFGLQQLPTRIEVMNLKEYAEYYNTRATIQGWGIRDDFRDISLLSDGTDWQKELFRTAPMHNHTVSIGGGSGGVRYMLSGGYFDQDGIGLASNYRRFTVRNNTEMEVTKWLNAGVNAGVSNTKQTNTSEANGAIRSAINQRPDVAARNPDGTYGFLQDDQFAAYSTSPLAEALLRENYNTGTSLTYNFYANLKPLPGLTLRLEYGGNLNYGNSYRFTPNYRYGGYGSTHQWTSEAGKGSNKGSYYAFKQILTYNRKFADKHNLTFMATHEAMESKWENLSGSRQGYLFDNVHSLSVGNSTTAQNGDSSGGSAMESYLGRLIYNFDERYLLTATLRTDGSSTFGPNNRWGTFPSAALGWRIKNESFLKDVEAINNLKLRLEWGLTGNQRAEMYAYGVRMTSTATAWGTGFFPYNYGNPDLKWEETAGYNLGLDLAAFNNRLEFIVEAYNKNTDYLVMTATLPTYAIYLEDWLAIRPPYVNTGAINNKGMEFTLNTVNIDKKDLFWKTGLTLSFNKNKLVKLYNESDAIYGQTGGNIYTRTLVGEPIGQLFGYKVIGMFTCEDDFYQKDASGNFIYNEDGSRKEVARPGVNGVPYDIADNQIWVGDYIFEDQPTEPVYDEQGKLIGYVPDGVIDEKDRTFLGNTRPKFDYGINNTLTWKNFELNVFINGVYGNKVYNVLRQSYSGTDGYVGKLKEVAGYARVELIDPEGERVLSNLHVTNAATATTSRVYATAGSRNDNNRISSRYVEDGSYLRIKNVSLSYNVPRQWLQKNLRMDYLQVYANVQNLYTFTKYKGYDPEIGSSEVRLTGVDNARYPSQRIYNFGVKFNF
jgi:TonB-linked SusC/RagA family outer membrane protein